jgi:hypothetical protein
MRGSGAFVNLKSSLSMLIVGAFLGLVACSGGADFSESCDSDSDCGDGLYCETRGLIAGLCTRACDSSSECKNSVGGDSFCSTQDNCVHYCGRSGGSCPDGSRCIVQSTGLDYCAK